MIKFFVSLMTVLSAATASAQMRTTASWVKVRPDRELYVEYTAPRPGFPTVVLLNGLTYSTRQFDSYTAALQNRGVGVLRFDFDGMGKTLLRYAPSTAMYSVEQQVADLKTLLTATGLRPPYSIAGLSYGGGIAIAYAATYPRDIRHLILMAPYTAPLTAQDQWVRSQIWATRMTFPANPATDEQLYDFFFRQIVYATYPQVEPIVLENPFKLEAVFNLARGIRRLNVSDIVGRMPAGTVHLMTAVSDQYIPGPVLDAFWGTVPPQARMSRIKVYQTEHKMPEAVPDFTAAWTFQILKNNPELRGGRDFEAWPLTMTVRSNGREIPINQ